MVARLLSLLFKIKPKITVNLTEEPARQKTPRWLYLFGFHLALALLALWFYELSRTEFSFRYKKH